MILYYFILSLPILACVAFIGYMAREAWLDYHYYPPRFMKHNGVWAKWRIKRRTRNE